MMKSTLFVFVVLWFWLVSASPAQAYLDPGSGSMLVQVLLGGSAAFFVLLRLGWRRFRTWMPFRRETDNP